MIAPHLPHSAINSATPQPAFTSRENPPSRFCSLESFASTQQEYARRMQRSNPPQVVCLPSKAAFNVAMSSLIIFIIASVARLAFARSGSSIILNITVGTICHEMP